MLYVSRASTSMNGLRNVFAASKKGESIHQRALHRVRCARGNQKKHSLCIGPDKKEDAPRWPRCRRVHMNLLEIIGPSGVWQSAQSSFVLGTPWCIHILLARVFLGSTLCPLRCHISSSAPSSPPNKQPERII